MLCLLGTSKKGIFEEGIFNDHLNIKLSTVEEPPLIHCESGRGGEGFYYGNACHQIQVAQLLSNLFDFTE